MHYITNIILILPYYYNIIYLCLSNKISMRLLFRLAISNLNRSPIEFESEQISRCLLKSFPKGKKSPETRNQNKNSVGINS